MRYVWSFVLCTMCVCGKPVPPFVLEVDHELAITGKLNGRDVALSVDAVATMLGPTPLGKFLDGAGEESIDLRVSRGMRFVAFCALLQRLKMLGFTQINLSVGDEHLGTYGLPNRAASSGSDYLLDMRHPFPMAPVVRELPPGKTVVLGQCQDIMMGGLIAGLRKARGHAVRCAYCSTF